MSYSIIATPRFKRRIKKLAKKYTSIQSDISNLAQSLRANPKQGVALGNDCFKIRLAIKSKGKGKSSGARVVTYVKVIEETIFLLTIYDKSDMVNISENELNKLLKELK